MNIFELKDLVNNFTEKNIISYISVLNCLTNVYNNEDELEFLIENFKDYVLSLPENIKIFIIFEMNDIIGSGTLVIESKIIHGFGKVGHIEDIVIDNKYQSKGYGSKLINFLIEKSKDMGCYKVVLNCEDDKVSFYEKNTPENCRFKISKKVSYYFK